MIAYETSMLFVVADAGQSSVEVRVWVFLPRRQTLQTKLYANEQHETKIDYIRLAKLQRDLKLRQSRFRAKK